MVDTLQQAQQILGVKDTSNLKEAKSRYRKLSKIYHPDMPTGDIEKFKQVKDAYELLLDPSKAREQQSNTGGYNYSYSASPYHKSNVGQPSGVRRAIKTMNVTHTSITDLVFLQ